MRRLDPEALQRAAERRLNASQTAAPITSEEEYRRAEYKAFVLGRGDENTDLLVQVLESGSYAPAVRPFIRRVGLIRKLRETRALAGFTRLLPPEDADDPGSNR